MIKKYKTLKEVIKIKKQITRKQHYVWQRYLNPWLIKGKFWWKRGSDVKNTNTKSILVLKDNYKIERLNKDEQLLLEKMFYEDKNETVNMLNGEMLLYLKIFNQLEDISTKNLSLKVLDDYRIQMGEEIISDSENIGVKSLDRILKGDISFFNNENSEEDSDDTFDFLYFCCYQYFRTKKMRDRIIKIMSSKEALEKIKTNFSKEINWDKIMAQGIHGLVIKICYGMYVTHSKYYLTLLESSDDDFTTSDQPVFNMKEKAKENKFAEEFMLYFPISPNKALIISNNIKENNIKQVTKEEVDYYNSLVRKHTHEFFIGLSKELVEKY